MNLNNLVHVDDVKMYLREILAKTDDASDDQDANQILALFKCMIEHGVKCKPRSLKDPLVRLLELMGYVRIASQPDSIIITEHHRFSLMHDPSGGSWTMSWLVDPQKDISMENMGSLILDGEFQIFTKFSLMWDLCPHQEVFDSIRIA